MDAGVWFPLASCGAVVLIVALTQLTRVRDIEVDVRQRIYLKEREHEREMKELNRQLQSLRSESKVRDAELKIQG